jgi:NADH-quinone oxidoreductase subunit N
MMITTTSYVLMKFEWLVAGIIFILLFIKVGNRQPGNITLLKVVNILLLVNFIAGFFLNADGTLFGDMFRTDQTAALEKNILNLGTLIISAQAYPWLKNHRHVLEFYILLLSALLGMFFIISSGNLLMFYLGLELSTIPLAAICNFDLQKRTSSEAAMKLIISSAFSSALLLLGISLVYGSSGTLNFAELSQHLTGSALQLFGFILLVGGFAFKISVVPFHLWTADVYEGSPVPVTSFLSVVSKAAFVFVLVSVLYHVFGSIADTWYDVLFLLSILTMLVGNLFAIRQNNLKRFLAFSSITQMGFILVGITGSGQMGSAAVIYFLLIYVLSNLGAFGVVAFVSALTGKENIEDYRDFYKHNPFLSWTLAISLFSLAGIPPTAGFFGKFFLIMAGAGKGNYVLISIAAFNMVISLYYYLKVVRAMFMDPNEEPIPKLSIDTLPKLALLTCVACIIVVGFIPSIYDYIYALSLRF